MISDGSYQQLRLKRGRVTSSRRGSLIGRRNIFFSPCAPRSNHGKKKKERAHIFFQVFPCRIVGFPCVWGAGVFPLLGTCRLKKIPCRWRRERVGGARGLERWPPFKKVTAVLGYINSLGPPVQCSYVRANFWGFLPGVRGMGCWYRWGFCAGMGGGEGGGRVGFCVQLIILRRGGMVCWCGSYSFFFNCFFRADFLSVVVVDVV